MVMLVRIYASEQGARDADAKLSEAGFGKRAVFLANEHQGQAADAVQAANRAGTLPERMAKICTDSLAQGRSLLSVDPPFGTAQRAINIMENGDTVESDRSAAFTDDDPAPFSRMLGMPVLSDFSSSTGLLPSRWSFSAGFGMGLLSRNAAPFSSMFGMKILTNPKRRDSSFGMPLGSRNPAPLSSLLGMKPLLSRQRSGDYSFGFPLLSNNPAPLSSLIGIRTLSKDR